MSKIVLTDVQKAYLKAVRAKAKNDFSRALQANSKDGAVYVQGPNILNFVSTVKHYFDATNLDIVHKLGFQPDDTHFVRFYSRLVFEAIRKSFYEAFPQTRYYLCDVHDIGDTAFLVLRPVPGMLWGKVVLYSNRLGSQTLPQPTVPTLQYLYYVDRFSIMSSLRVRFDAFPIVTAHTFSRIDVLRSFVSYLFKLSMTSDYDPTQERKTLLSFTLSPNHALCDSVLNALSNVKNHMYPDIDKPITDLFALIEAKGLGRIHVAALPDNMTTNRIQAYRKRKKHAQKQEESSGTNEE